MSLYNKEYIDGYLKGSNNSNSTQESVSFDSGYGVRSREDTISFLKATYQLFAASILAAAVGAYIGISYFGETVKAWYWGFVILEFVMLFGLYATKKKAGVNLIMLFGFTFLTGLTITPLLSAVMGLSGGASIVAQAFLMTSVAFGGISFFAMTTKKDFSSMGKMLFIALIVMVVAGLLNIFLQSPILQLMLAGAGAILFSFFILYDTQNIINGAYETPIEGAVALYLDFFNLFISLLQLLGIFSSDD